MKLIVRAISLLLAFALCGLCACSAPPPTPPLTGDDPFATAGTSLPDPERTDALFAEVFSLQGTVMDGFSERQGVYTITKGGDYYVSGTLNGQIQIDVPKEDKVKLILNGIYLFSDTLAPIRVLCADELTVKAEDGSYNLIHDMRPSELTVYDDAAIYSKEDLTFSGRGTLIVRSDRGMGAHSTNDVTFKNITMKVTAYDTAVKGNDSISVTSSSKLTLLSHSEDGLKTSNTDISDKGKQRGDVSIESGNVCIHSLGDGIQAAHNAVVYDLSTLCIRTGSYAAVAFGGDTEPPMTGSAKGIKAENELLLKGGTVDIRSTDDALRANIGTTFDSGTTGVGNVAIGGGLVRCVSDAKAVYAGRQLSITGGTVHLETVGEAREAAIRSVGPINYMNATVFVFGSSSAIPNGAIAFSDLPLPVGTGTIKQDGKALVAFTLHDAQSEGFLLDSRFSTEGASYEIILSQQVVGTWNGSDTEVAIK